LFAGERLLHGVVYLWLVLIAGIDRKLVNRPNNPRTSTTTTSTTSTKTLSAYKAAVVDELAQLDDAATALANATNNAAMRVFAGDAGLSTGE
jgi:hypothetical protein